MATSVQFMAPMLWKRTKAFGISTFWLKKMHPTKKSTFNSTCQLVVRMIYFRHISKLSKIQCMTYTKYFKIPFCHIFVKEWCLEQLQRRKRVQVNLWINCNKPNVFISYNYNAIYLYYYFDVSIATHIYSNAYKFNQLYLHWTFYYKNTTNEIK